MIKGNIETLKCIFQYFECKHKYQDFSLRCTYEYQCIYIVTCMMCMWINYLLCINSYHEWRFV